MKNKKDIILNTIKKLTEADTKTLEQRALKLSEETGEVSNAMLSYIKASGCDYKNLGKEDITEECVDVITVAFSILFDIGVEDEDIFDMFIKKLSKWESVI